MSDKIRTLEEGFLDEIRDLYDAEKQLVRALPKMAKGAKAEQLKTAFRDHLEMTKGQVARLEQVFQMLGQKAKSKPCKGMKGLVEEGQEHMEVEAPPNVADLVLIGAAQKVEHYEISGYGTVRTMAQQLGHKDVAALLEQTLREEEATDKLLTQLAKGLYREAKTAGESGGKEEAAGSRWRTSRSGGRATVKRSATKAAGRSSRSIELSIGDDEE